MGHEMIGIAVRVGTRVDASIKVGDRVGVGAQSDSCHKPPDVAEDWSDCTEYATGKENCRNCKPLKVGRTKLASSRSGSSRWRGGCYVM